MEQKHYFVACAVINNERGEIFLTKRHSPHNAEVHNKWQLPGGSVEAGEHPQDAALREVKEETGLTIRLLSDRPFIFSHSFTNDVHIVLLVYATAYVGGEIDISGDLEETSDAGWFLPHEVSQLSLLPNTDTIIQQVLSAKE